MRRQMIDDGPEDWTEYVTRDEPVALSPSGGRFAVATETGVVLVELGDGARREFESSGEVRDFGFVTEEVLLVEERGRFRLLNLRGDHAVVSQSRFLLAPDGTSAVGFGAASVRFVNLADFTSESVADLTLI